MAHPNTTLLELYVPSQNKKANGLPIYTSSYTQLELEGKVLTFGGQYKKCSVLLDKA